MEILSPNQKLDIVLAILNKEYNEKTGTDYTYNLCVPDIISRVNGRLSKEEVQLILDKLIKDGYVYPIEDLPYEINRFTGRIYSLTFEGLVFIESGGYKAQFMISNRDEIRKLKNDRRLINATWFAGFAAILVLLWQFFLYLYRK